MGDWALSAEGEDGGLRATLRLGLHNNAALPLEVPDSPLPAQRPEASEESLVPGTVMGSVRKNLKDGSPRELLEAANQILMANYALQPWIHTASKLQWFQAPSAGQTIDVRAEIEDVFARKGQSMVRYAVAYLAGDIPLLNVTHTAIWRLPLK
jgi:hypothetical protein